MYQFIYEIKYSYHNQGDGGCFISIPVIVSFGSTHGYFPPNLLI